MITNAAFSNEDLLARLVAFDTVSCNSNLPLADFISEYLDLPGVTIEQHRSPDDQKANLVIRTGAAEADLRAGLTLSGHMDVVPAEEPDWRSDPFSLTEENGALVGRGACDMKGFIALAVNQLHRVSRLAQAHAFALVLTYDEEVGTLGARHLVENWPGIRSLPKNVIVGEPTSLHAVRMHKGHVKIAIELSGKAAHSGYPHLGRSAIEPAGKVIAALTELRTELESERAPNSDYFSEVPHPALNIGTVRGGVAVNVIPDECVIEVGIRTLPGMPSEQLADRVRKCLVRSVGSSNFRMRQSGESPPMELASDAQLYETIVEELKQQDTHAASFATDAGWFQSAGMECVLFGPGDMENAHRANERISISQLRQAEAILHKLIDHFCGTEY